MPSLEAFVRTVLRGVGRQRPRPAVASGVLPPVQRDGEQALGPVGQKLAGMPLPTDHPPSRCSFFHAQRWLHSRCSGTMCHMGLKAQTKPVPIVVVITAV